MSAAVRPIALSDVPGYHQAVDSVAKERRYLMRLEAPPLERAQSFVADNLKKGYPHVVAVDEDKAVGWADIVPRNNFPPAAHVGVLGMGIIKAYRGQGLGSSLLTAVIKGAWNYGFKRLELEVYHDNEAAVRLYEKHGFELEGRKRYARYLDGAYQDILIMAQFADSVEDRRTKP